AAPGFRSGFFLPHGAHGQHHAPRDASVLERICGAPILFGQSGNRIVMNKAEADRVHRAEDKSLIEILERHIGDLVNEPAAGDIVTEKVQALISIYLGRKPVTVATLAAELKMSTRSLQRRLSEEGVSLRDLVRQHRQTLAAHYLGDRHAAPMAEQDGRATDAFQHTGVAWGV
ncbi:hypothetical protein ACCS78_39460, partial [Rhizobium johnstonii]